MMWLGMTRVYIFVAQLTLFPELLEIRAEQKNNNKKFLKKKTTTTKKLLFVSKLSSEEDTLQITPTLITTARVVSTH